MLGDNVCVSSDALVITLAPSTRPSSESPFPSCLWWVSALDAPSPAWLCNLNPADVIVRTQFSNQDVQKSQQIHKNDWKIKLSLCVSIVFFTYIIIFSQSDSCWLHNNEKAEWPHVQTEKTTRFHSFYFLKAKSKPGLCQSSAKSRKNQTKWLRVVCMSVCVHVCMRVRHLTFVPI